ncbi:unnamed protein product [Schistosoma mattheei]|uniref:Uncharacterized protein n=1 Tax=Schistosoma mattheei TaxID=31246 RepID=A0A183NXP8_9TREM|nr:unnamed protein product [Schistosoma mattheei]
MWLTRLNSSSKPSHFIIKKMSTTHLKQTFGEREHLGIALVSNEYMNKLATIEETGDSIATLSVCLYEAPRKLETVESIHRSNPLITFEGRNGHRCLSSVSESKRLYTISKTFLTGTLVNTEYISKLAINSSSMRIVMIMSLKSVEYFIPYLITLSHGLRILARYLERL